MSDESLSITAILEIRRNADGRIVRSERTWEYYGDYIWSEGNFSCDCNRYLFFCRATGEEEAPEDSPEHNCGDDRYSVRLTDVLGNVLYSEFEERGISCSTDAASSPG